jgi:hypothetical protein
MEAREVFGRLAAGIARRNAAVGVFELRYLQSATKLAGHPTGEPEMVRVHMGDENPRAGGPAEGIGACQKLCHAATVSGNPVSAIVQLFAASSSRIVQTLA